MSFRTYSSVGQVALPVWILIGFAMLRIFVAPFHAAAWVHVPLSASYTNGHLFRSHVAGYSYPDISCKGMPLTMPAMSEQARHYDESGGLHGSMCYCLYEHEAAALS